MVCLRKVPHNSIDVTEPFDGSRVPKHTDRASSELEVSADGHYCNQILYHCYLINSISYYNSIISRIFIDSYSNPIRRSELASRSRLPPRGYRSRFRVAMGEAVIRMTVSSISYP